MTETATTQLEREAAAAIASAPPDPTIATATPPPSPAEAPGVITWRMYTAPAMQLIRGLVLPQWNLTAEELHELTEALAQILALHFPDGLDGKYAGYFRLIACSSFIVATRYAAGGGKLPPLGPPRPPKAEQPAEEQAGPAPDPHAPIN